MSLGLFDTPQASGATFSPCRRYRYTLTRRWSDALTTAVFCALNPSTADEREDDPTIRREIDFAKRWGHGGLIKVNLFAWRSTDSLGLLETSDPVGPENDNAISRAMWTPHAVVIACWGSHKKTSSLAWLVGQRAAEVRAMLRDLGVQPTCFGTNADGQPKHPLYLAASTPLRVLP